MFMLQCRRRSSGMGSPSITPWLDASSGTCHRSIQDLIVPEHFANESPHDVLLSRNEFVADPLWGWQHCFEAH